MVAIVFWQPEMCLKGFIEFDETSLLAGEDCFQAERLAKSISAEQ
jgi:hypothetical protein